VVLLFGKETGYLVGSVVFAIFLFRAEDLLLLGLTTHRASGSGS